jgi:hypothetical protein
MSLFFLLSVLQSQQQASGQSRDGSAGMPGSTKLPPAGVRGSAVVGPYVRAARMTSDVAAAN